MAIIHNLASSFDSQRSINIGGEFIRRSLQHFAIQFITFTLFAPSPSIKSFGGKLNAAENELCFRFVFTHIINHFSFSLRIIDLSRYKEFTAVYPRF